MISALGRQREDDHGFEVNLSYIARLCPPKIFHGPTSVIFGVES